MNKLLSVLLSSVIIASDLACLQLKNCLHDGTTERGHTGIMKGGGGFRKELIVTFIFYLCL